MTADATTCAICGEAERDPRLVHECYGCGVMYHLNPYSNRPGKDCGDAVLGEEELGVYYYCERCLDDLNARAPGGTPDAAPASEPPPRSSRPPSQRRYRRIDRS